MLKKMSNQTITHWQDKLCQLQLFSFTIHTQNTANPDPEMQTKKKRPQGLLPNAKVYDEYWKKKYQKKQPKDVWN